MHPLSFLALLRSTTLSSSAYFCRISFGHHLISLVCYKLLQWDGEGIEHWGRIRCRLMRIRLLHLKEWLFEHRVIRDYAYQLRVMAVTQQSSYHTHKTILKHSAADNRIDSATYLSFPEQHPVLHERSLLLPIYRFQSIEKATTFTTPRRAAELRKLPSSLQQNRKAGVARKRKAFLRPGPLSLPILNRIVLCGKFRSR